MSSRVFFVSSHGQAPPVCHALCFSCVQTARPRLYVTWPGPAWVSRPVFFREFAIHTARPQPAPYVTPCEFCLSVHMARPQRVCRAPCFLSSHGQAPACMSRPVFLREITWQGPSLYATPRVHMARPQLPHPVCHDLCLS